MMSFKVRLGVVFLIICALVLEIYAGVIDKREKESQTVDEHVAKDAITLWYTDEALTDFLNSVALTYYEDTDVHVNLKLVSGLEYLETINEGSVRGGEYPDLYIVGNDSLGKAYLSGLACEIKDKQNVLTTDFFCPTALSAVTYNGKFVAYPMYFETSYLLYNKTYLKQVLQEQLVREQGLEEQDLGNPLFQQQLEQRIEEIVPNTVTGILDFANRYDAPENVDAIFKWDVSDIFYNYFFAGNYLNIGGVAGDDVRKIDIYNENAIRCLNIYQSLNQFFSIEADETTYDSVMQEFIDGRIIFTIATTDAVAMLDKAKADGIFAYEYGVALIPNLTEELGAREVSVTSAVAVNGYSDKKEAAYTLARYLCTGFANTLYARTGKVSARRSVPYNSKEEQEVFSVIEQAYELSIPMPKVVELSNFWVELEMCYTNIWMGDDANETLKKFSEKIKQKITGEESVEEYIDVPDEEVFYDDI